MAKNNRPQKLISFWIGQRMMGRTPKDLELSKGTKIYVIKPSQEPKDPWAFLSKSLLVKEDAVGVRMAHMVKLGSLSGVKKRKKRHKGKKRKKR